MNNILEKSGDYFIVSYDGLLSNIDSILSYQDSIEGDITIERGLSKDFRYSLDGVTYSNWITLTISNLSSLKILSGNIFSFQFRYTRTGTDNTGQIIFNDLDLFLKLSPIKYHLYEQSIFKQFFEVNDPEVLRWAINVLDKLYGDGIVAKYIEKDNDFTTFFGWLTHWWALIVKYARSFKVFDLNSILLSEYLRQRGIIVRDKNYLQEDQSNITITSQYTLLKLQTLLYSMFKEFSKRGTYQVVDKETQTEFEGELFRLIQFNKDEFILSLIDKHSTNWVLSKGSPLYRGTQNLTNISKNIEF